MSDTIPTGLPHRLLVALPNDGSSLIALGTDDYCEFNAHLRRLGHDPEQCLFGHAEPKAYELEIAWDRTVRIEA
jgi:hypothetical protein